MRQLRRVVGAGALGVALLLSGSPAAAAQSGDEANRLMGPWCDGEVGHGSWFIASYPSCGPCQSEADRLNDERPFWESYFCTYNGSNGLWDLHGRRW